jgi:hypothetical protein
MSTAYTKLISKTLTSIITLADAKAQLRIPADLTDQDTLITSCLQAAIRYAETVTDRVIAPSVFQIRIPATAATIVLPFPDFIKVTKVEAMTGSTVGSVLYNETGPVGTLADYLQIDSWVNPAEITVLTDDLPDDTDYLLLTASFGMQVNGAAAYPEDMLNAIKMMMTHFFNNPSEVEVGRIASKMPVGAETILSFYTYRAFS